MGKSRPIFVYFRSFKSNYTIFQQSESVHSGNRTHDLFYHESAPPTTRPGLPPFQINVCCIIPLPGYDQMPRYFINNWSFTIKKICPTQYLTIDKVGSKFCQILNKPLKLPRCLKFREIWSRCKPVQLRLARLQAHSNLTLFLIHILLNFSIVILMFC